MNKGILAGAAAYLFWGFFPIYLKAIQVVPAVQILFHRVAWSFVFLLVLIFVRNQQGQLKIALSSRRSLAIYSLAALLLAANWLTYVWGVNSGQVVETSLGYFINPLLNVLLGVIFLGERLRPMQWLPVGLAAAGVIYLTVSFGALPWIALALAFTFGLYALIKKISPLEALAGLTLETGLLFLPAAGYLVYLGSQGEGSFGHLGWSLDLLLAFAGIVTAVPLLLFATAARRIPLWMVGLLQYIAPTCQFLLGILVYREPFSQVRLVGFVVIWIALVVFTLEGFLARHRPAPRAELRSVKQ
ncbi:MAG TPA: EamA family transporter RarD [Anaerolineales bacterium]|nr:EamA family transporter RarD [Anaerolineales bacterium]